MSDRVQPAAKCIQEVCAKCIVTFQTYEDPLVSLSVTCIFVEIMILKSWFKANTKVKTFTALLTIDKVTAYSHCVILEHLKKKPVF